MPPKSINEFNAVVTPALADPLLTQQDADNITRKMTVQQILDLIATISQAEAEAGVATTRRIWTAQRVAQAIAALESPSFPSGTRMIFDQDSAPTGWTRDVTTINDKVIRIVTGVRADGGSWVVSGLSTVSAGGHSHTVNSHTHSASGLGFHNHTGLGAGNTLMCLEHGVTDVGSASPGTDSQGAHTHTVDSDGTWRPLHRDMIVCSKD